MVDKYGTDLVPVLLRQRDHDQPDRAAIFDRITGTDP